MIRKLLKEVRSTSRGLIGITEDDKEVLLSAPEPKFFEIKVPVGGQWKNKEVEKRMKKEYDKTINNILMEEDSYIQLGKRDGEFLNFKISQPYNIYTKRK